MSRKLQSRNGCNDCVYVCVHAHMRTWVSVCVCVCACVRACVRACVCVCVTTSNMYICVSMCYDIKPRAIIPTETTRG